MLDRAFIPACLHYGASTLLLANESKRFMHWPQPSSEPFQAHRGWPRAKKSSVYDARFPWLQTPTLGYRGLN
ncbi:hypothetical protein O9992_00295 [Vibrio lentus]|nr:hypothetical protein [Vibrio lentus]